MTRLARLSLHVRAQRYLGRRLLVVPAFAAVVVVAGLLAMLARPEAVLRYALDYAVTAAGTHASTGTTAGATSLQSRSKGRTTARVTVSETGDLIVRAADPHAPPPMLTSNDAPRPATAVFAIGDRFTVGANGGSRTLEVVDVSDSGPDQLAVRPIDGTTLRLNLVLITCRVLDAAGEPIPGETLRFLATAEPRSTPAHVIAPLPPATPGTL